MAWLSHKITALPFIVSPHDLFFLINFTKFTVAVIQLVLPGCHHLVLKGPDTIRDLLNPFQMSETTLVQGVLITGWALALTAVCLRFFARRLSKAGFWYDDWLMIPAMVSTPCTIGLKDFTATENDPSSIFFPARGHSIVLCRRHLG